MGLQFLKVATHPTDSHRIADEIKLTRIYGRGIRRLVTLCGTVTQLVAEYDRRFLESESDDDGGDDNIDGDEDVPPENKAEVRRLVFLDTLLVRRACHGLTGTPQTSRSGLPIVSRAREVDSLTDGEDC